MGNAPSVLRILLLFSQPYALNMKAFITSLIALILAFTLHAEDVSHFAIYYAQAVIEFIPASGVDANKVLAANLPRGDLSVTVQKVPHTTLFKILVSATDPKVAALRANQIALSLQSLLNDPDGGDKPVRIWQKASASDAIGR